MRRCAFALVTLSIAAGCASAGSSESSVPPTQANEAMSMTSVTEAASTAAATSAPFAVGDTDASASPPSTTSVVASSSTLGRSTSTTAAPTTTTLPAPPVQLSIEATVAVDDGPKPIVTTYNRIWVATPTEILKIDATSNTVLAHIARADTIAMTVNPYPSGPPDAPEPIFACSTHDTVEIDSASATIVETYPYGCTGIVYGPNALQIMNGTDVVEIVPGGDLIADTPVGAGGAGLGYTDDAVWVANTTTATVTRLHSGFHTIDATVATPAATTNQVLGTHAAIWVTTTPNTATADQTSLIRIDPATNRIAQTYAEGIDANGLDLSGRFLWVTGKDSMFIIDTATNEVVARPQLLTGASTGHVVAANGSVWMTIDSPGAVVRIDPGSFGDAEPITQTTPIRIEVNSGCPSTIGVRSSLQGTPFANPDTTGLADEFVPDAPSGALICRFAGVDFAQTGHGSVGVIGGNLTGHTQLNATAAITLAHTANDVQPAPFSVSGCMPASDGTRYIVIAFTYAGKPDVDLWYIDGMCPNLSNGTKDAGPFVNGYGRELATLISSP
jgi:hypothetical protein